MATQPDFTPDTIEPQSPPEAPMQEPQPGFQPDAPDETPTIQPDHDEPDRSPDETPPL